jgi:hypothetical protein
MNMEGICMVSDIVKKKKKLNKKEIFFALVVLFIGTL